MWKRLREQTAEEIRINVCNNKRGVRTQRVDESGSYVWEDFLFEPNLVERITYNYGHSCLFAKIPHSL